MRLARRIVLRWVIYLCSDCFGDGAGYDVRSANCSRYGEYFGEAPRDGLHLETCIGLAHGKGGVRLLVQRAWGLQSWLADGETLP